MTSKNKKAMGKGINALFADIDLSGDGDSLGIDEKKGEGDPEPDPFRLRLQAHPDRKPRQEAIAFLHGIPPRC